MHVFDMLDQLRNRVERRLAFLHTTAHHPSALEVDAFVELDESLMNMPRRIVGKMMREVFNFLELVVTVVPMAFIDLQQIVSTSGTK